LHRAHSLQVTRGQGCEAKAKAWLFRGQGLDFLSSRSREVLEDPIGKQQAPIKGTRAADWSMHVLKTM